MQLTFGNKESAKIYLKSLYNKLCIDRHECNCPNCRESHIEVECYDCHHKFTEFDANDGDELIYKIIKKNYNNICPKCGIDLHNVNDERDRICVLYGLNKIDFIY